MNATHETMPDGCAKYGESPVFTAESVPEKLRASHSLKAGTWGKMRVEQGRVEYFLEGETQPLKIIEVGTVHIIPPEERHYITVSPDVRFQIEFWK